MKRALIPLAEGFEEIEATVCANVLRRAGIEVVLAGIPGTMVRGARNVKLMADRKLSEVRPEEFDAIILVGGDPGYKNLGLSTKVMEAVRDFESKGKLVAAICAAPALLSKLGLLENRVSTIYPGMEREVPRPRGHRVVKDSNVITSQAPGTALEFALMIVENLAGEHKAMEVRRDIVC